MSKLWSNSTLFPGMIDEIEVAKIKQSRINLRSGSLNNQNDGEELRELTNSIIEKGLLQPIIVRSRENLFEIVAGNRRYRACKAIGWRKIACHIVELNDKEALEVSLTENIQRKTLSPIEEAHSFKAYVSDYGWGGVSELATKLGKSITYIAKRIRLLNLPSDVLESINNSELDTSTVEELLSIKDGNRQSELANLISKRRLSMRKTRELLREVDKDPALFAGTIFEDRYNDDIVKAQRSFDKAIIVVRIALNRLSTIIEGIDDNWIVFDVLMNHKAVLHGQIDILIKEKRKLKEKFNAASPWV